MSGEDELNFSEIKWLGERLAVLEEERRQLQARLDLLRSEELQVSAPSAVRDQVREYGPARSRLSLDDKVRLFRSLFRGREDVYPRRWESQKTGKAGYSPACRNEWVPGACEKPKVKCGECGNRELLPVTDAVIWNHLTGHDPDGRRDFTIGVYPLLEDETCLFVAADFDKESWADDARTLMEVCGTHQVPAALERSRSGNGGHVWLFFTEAIAARDARNLATWLLSETMELYPSLGFRSYDRLFPNQDTMPAGGFGSLIALPLQGRTRRSGNSVFVDSHLQPFEDQWAYLSGVRRMQPSEVAELIERASASRRIIPLRTPITNETAEPWERPSRVQAEPVIPGPLPATVQLVLANQVYVRKNDLSTSLVARLLRLAAFQNPEFYRAQAMRLSTFGKPRVISCAEDFPDAVGLPRGCRDDLEKLLNSLGIAVVIEDRRCRGLDVDLRFEGMLEPHQEEAYQSLARHDIGVLAAPTAFGKTVVAARAIAERGLSTLVVVHRRQLLEQWIAQLERFLDLGSHQLGQIGGGRRKPSGVVDVALIQSLVRDRAVDECVAEYGHVVFDECHHLSAVSFEAVARAAHARYVLGLTATVARKDGHHPVVLMQCGPIRHRVSARHQARERPFVHRVVQRHTQFAGIPGSDPADKPAYHNLCKELAANQHRNDLVFDDVLNALEEGRSPLVLTQRREHLELLVSRFSGFARNVIVLKGGIGRRQLAAELATLASIPKGEERLILATGPFLGEGFDDHRLDTLFLVMPISWRGTLAQYVGRLHRLHHGKTDVLVYDYVDHLVPTLARMADKRLSGYRGLGYKIADGTTGPG